MIRCVELCVEYHYHIVFATWNDCWKFFHIGTQAFNITMPYYRKEIGNITNLQLKVL